MTLDELKSAHPDLAQALIDEGSAAGAKAERERIQAVEAQALPGHEALIATLKFDGKTSGPEAAVQILAAEKAKNSTVLATLKAEAPAPAAPSAPVEAVKAAEDANLSIEERAKREFEGSAEIRAEFGDNLARYTAYRKAEQRRAGK